MLCQVTCGVISVSHALGNNTDTVSGLELKSSKIPVSFRPLLICFTCIFVLLSTCEILQKKSTSFDGLSKET